MGIADKGRHAAEDLKGKVKEGVGQASGDDELEASGQRDQAAASMKQTGEKVKDAAAKAAGAASDTVKKAADKVGESIDSAKRRDNR